MLDSSDLRQIKEIVQETVRDEVLVFENAVRLIVREELDAKFRFKF